MLFSLNVGKVDAGVAVLLTEDMRVIEFPSILLPDGIKSGSIVNISVSRNRAAEASKEKDFRELQTSIWETYGRQTPAAPVLRCRNTTQTAVVLEWDALELATAKLRSLSIYRNGEKMGNIPDARGMTSTKISGLAVDRAYTFQLELRTSSGTYRSDLLRVHTHKMTELGGITVTPGILPPAQRDALVRAVDRIGGRIADTVRLDTTHFVCTDGRGREWERARDMNVPVVRPEWVEGCEQEGRMVGVKDYYLDADPKLRPMPQLSRQTTAGSNQQQQQQQQQQTASSATSTTAAAAAAGGSTAQASLKSSSASSVAQDAGRSGNGSGSSSRTETVRPEAAAGKAKKEKDEEDEDDEDDDDEEEIETSSRVPGGNSKNNGNNNEHGSEDDEETENGNGQHYKHGSGTSYRTAADTRQGDGDGQRKQQQQQQHQDDEDDEDEEEETADQGNFEEVAL